MNQPMIDLDYHVHSGCSPDATGVSMEKMCESAVEQGIGQIVFTDHFEFYTDGFQGYPFNETYLQRYFNELSECRKKFGSRLTVLSGMEFGQIHLQPLAMEWYRSHLPFDYLIGSLHKLDNTDLKDMDYRSDLGGTLNRYFNSLYDMVSAGGYDCVGHIDLIRRYAAKQGIQISSEYCAGRFDRILKKIIQLGKGIEINTSGLRQEAHDTFPSPEILKRYHELGGTIVTVGSDAHRPQDVGAGFDRAAEILAEAGFNSICEFRNHKPSFRKIA